MNYELFIRKIGQFTGRDLTYYRRHQIERRINSLMRSQGFNNYYEYLNILKKDCTQLEKFFSHLTINVSEFYRNPIQWEILSNRILPELLKINPQIKTWSAGCATGEEPYTLALIMHEKMKDSFPQILATDIDEKALEKAREGIYHEKTVANVPKVLLARYFEKKEKEFYRIKEEIKKLVKFRRHDLFRDTFGSNFDLIICRNVVIYFTEKAKNMLYRRFLEALRPGGVLFTGSTEQIFHSSQFGLETVASFFYRKTAKN